MKMKVLVYDDYPKIAQRLARRVQEACGNADVSAVERKTFVDLMQVMNHRRGSWRSPSSEATSIASVAVDEADIVVIDYDLLHYSDSGDTTGSRLAYLLRCFTKCGLIIVLNEHGPNVFDLTLQSSSIDFADLHLGAEQIGNPGLWTGSIEGYRPWHWPVLPDASEKFEKCVEDVQEHFDQPILPFFGLEGFIDWLPKQAYDFFLGSGKMETVRFSTFVEKAHGGIETKDKIPDEHIARVAAARLISLLNGLIIPEQGPLVDAPHLVSRFPSLIRDGGQEIHYWNRLCEPLNEEVDSLLVDGLTEHRFKRQHWLWRPVWYWPDIAKDDGIPEVRDPWTVMDIDWVFCEDVSRFVPEELTRSFRADVAPPFNKRFVLNRESAKASEFVSMVGSGGAQDPLEVEYVPQAAFSV